MKLDELRRRYTGEIATRYDDERVTQARWQREHRTLSRMLDRIGGSGATVLDVPVGTGRFLELYQDIGAEVIGVDASADMLTRARERAGEFGMAADLREGDITRLAIDAGAVEIAVCVRMLNLLDWPDAQRAMRELARVTRGHVLTNVQLWRPLPCRELGVAGNLRALRRRVGRWGDGSTRPHHEPAWERLLDECGLEQVERRSLGGSPYAPWWMIHLRVR